jgi:hypothetical protein
MQTNDDRDYSVRAELAAFDLYDDGRFQAYTLKLDDGRYVVVTDKDGMGLPTFGDFNACVYKSEEAFGDDPTDSLIASATSDNYDDIELALFSIGVY